MVNTSFCTLSSADRLRDKTTKTILPNLLLQRTVEKIQAAANNDGSSNTSRLEAHTDCFRLFMKRIFDPYCDLLTKS